MKAYSGFKSEAPATSFPQLPAGAYVGVIKDVRLEGAEPDQTLVLCLEVMEGEHAGYYTKRYQHDVNSNSDYTPRYKGVLRLRVPNPDNTKHNPCLIYHLVLPDKIRYNDFAGVPCEASPYCRNDFLYDSF